MNIEDPGSPCLATLPNICIYYAFSSIVKVTIMWAPPKLITLPSYIIKSTPLAKALVIKLIFP